MALRGLVVALALVGCGTQEAPTLASGSAAAERITRLAYARYAAAVGEWCNGEDDDGDGLVDEDYRDFDGDGLIDCPSDPVVLDEAIAPPGCGDGVQTADEGCDDGNRQGGDGCSVACAVETCSLGLGWWKTHYDGAEPPVLDQPWPLPEDTRLCGQTWLDILNTPPRGNPFNLFARVWIVAHLNRANGAGGPAEVDLALWWGERVLRDCIIPRPEFARAERVYRILEDYNEGALGIGSCEDQCGGGGCGVDLEVCDGVDNDGDGRVDEGFPDTDRDGRADCVDWETCDGLDNDGNGLVDDGLPDTDGDGICDERDVESCDGLDNDGNGVVDEGYPDADGDGVADCVDVEECDGRDNDGDGFVDEDFGDADGDGVADCRDVEECDGLDNDGDGDADEGLPDADGDGVCDGMDVETCDGLDNDGNGQVDEGFGDADGDGLADCVDVEECDGVDNDGDGVVDQGFADSDRDGRADCVDVEECDGLDNDGDGRVDEGMSDVDADGLCDLRDWETCDGVDNDGDGLADEGYPDTDGDGIADCVDVETCDGLDNDGNGVVDQGFRDGDGDGIADCVDVEECDGVDNDGDGRVDEGFGDGDGDGIADCVDDESCNGIDDDGDGLVDEGWDIDEDGRADCLETCADALVMCSRDDGSTRLSSGAAAVATWTGNPRWTATIPGATWLWDAWREGTPVTGRTLNFQRTFSLPEDAVGIEALLVVAADNSYETWINGYPVGADPTEFNYFDPADVWTASAGVAPGANLFEARVRNWPQSGGTADSNPGGLLYCLTVTWEVDEDEVCNGVDDDCDGLVDEGQSDVDGDGVCDALDEETCDGLDNDGDGLVDEGLADADGDGLCDGLDEEECDGIDNDGDGRVDEGLPDGDGDGVCDEVDEETCDGIDNDGDGLVDEGFRRGWRYEWSQSGGGSGSAGTIEWTRSVYDTALDELSFETRIRHPSGYRTKFFTVAINDGPNPKGQGDLALIYFDATRSGTPVVTSYAYNGENTFTSYYDGSSATGVQAPDRMFSSLLDPSFLLDAWASDDGTRISMGFTVQVRPFRLWEPLHAGAWSWYGLGFAERFGIWYHPSAGVSTAYSNGWLTSYTYAQNGWIDNSDQPTTRTEVCHARPAGG